MQTHFRYPLCAVCAVAIFLVSCTKTNTQGRFIPKEAAIVVELDGKSLSAKLPWEEIRQNPIFKEAFTDSTIPRAMKSILQIYYLMI